MTDMSTVDTKSWIPDTQSFGARLALIRWKMGWNLKEASAECELSANSWSQWEEGAMPRNFPQAVMSISARTGVNLYWLMTGKGPEGQPSDYKATGIRSIVKLSDRPRRRNDTRGPGSRAAA